MNIRTFALVTAFAFPTIAVAAPDATKPAPTAPAVATLSASDAAVLAHVHAVHVMEIEMGKVASKLGSTAVKAYGGELVKDHTSADKAAMALAKKKGLAVIPADVPATDADKAEANAMMEAMAHVKTLKGKEFTTEFLKLMVDGHTKEVGKLEAAIGTVADSELKAYLEKIKPVVQRHADGAKKLQGNA